MLKIRLTRTGRKKRPSYRIIVVDSKAKRDGKYKEKLGYYNPSEDPKKIVVDKDRFKYWKSVGAKPTISVSKLLNNKFSYIPYPQKKVEEEDLPANNGETKGDESLALEDQDPK